MSRMDRVNQQLKREIGIILQRDMSDPRFQFVSITHVDASKDLRNARVYFSVLGDASQVEAIEEALVRAAGFVRKFVGKKMVIRYTPELHFIYDKSIEESSRMEQTFREIHNEEEHH